MIWVISDGYKLLYRIFAIPENCDYFLFKDNTPALTFKIAEDYFENNITDEENNFNLADGFYSRTIPQDDLVLAFDSTDDGKLQKC